MVTSLEHGLVLVAAANPSRTQSSNTSTWAIVLVVIGVLVVAGIVAFNFRRRGN